MFGALMKTPKIIIIGAGLGGLALANGLARAGFDVSVFERDEGPDSRAQGYRISIRSLGMAALKELLTSDKFSRLSAAKIADVGDGFVYATSQLEQLLKIPLGEEAAVQLLRTELRNILLEGVNVEWNKKLVRFDEQANEVVAHFADGSKVAGDLLVGCDGGASKVRELMGSAGAKFLPTVTMNGLITFGGNIDRTADWSDRLPLNQFGMVRYLGFHGHSVGVCFSERKDRSPTVYWAWSEKMGEREKAWYHLDDDAVKRERLLEHCKHLVNKKGWHPNLVKLIHDTKASEMMEPWFLRTTSFPNNAHYPMSPHGRVTLLGDAAHSMPPDRGLGGNNVLEDARLLTSLLGQPQQNLNWQALLAQYESKMFARAKEAVEESNRAAKMHVMKNPISIWVRNMVLRVMGFVIAKKTRK